MCDETICIHACILFLFITPPKINNFVDTITGASMKYNMMDWFPLFEWIPLMLLGMYFIENINHSGFQK